MSKEILIYYTFLLIGITLAPLIFNRYILNFLTMGIKETQLIDLKA